ncbi:hypothetical protein BX600DRAFT_67086 [Xylariales sp. PMI_506]|nr:hypothetical protein BX600DRAFT_67086 [Xylariales sp. PMI_506]
MDTRNRAVSLPSSRRTSRNTSPMRSTTAPIFDRVSPMPALGRLPQRTVAWDRRVDVTFSSEPIFHNASRSKEERPRERTVPNNPSRNGKGRDKAVSNRKQSPHRDYPDLESLTYAAIVSILNYKQKRQHPDDEPFCRAVGSLYLSRDGPPPRNETHILFNLPERIRRRIWSHVVGSGDLSRPPKPVILQPFEIFLEKVWRASGFQNSGELLATAKGALSTCFALRVEVLAYILTSHRFHFTFSPYVREGTCPEMFHWMKEYSHLMQYTTIELDLSKLGFGASPAAYGLRPGNMNMDALVGIWVETQLCGRPSMRVENLVLLARRYHGVRPPRLSGVTADDPGSRPKQYCSPRQEFAAVAPILHLQGRINTLRIVGFNPSTTDYLLATLFPNVNYKAEDDILKHCHRAGVSSIWPFLPGQRSVHRDRQFGGIGKPHHSLPNIKIPVRTPSLARRKIVQLREMLEQNEEKRSHGRQPSGEVMQRSPATLGRALSFRSRRNTRDEPGVGQDHHIGTVGIEKLALHSEPDLGSRSIGFISISNNSVIHSPISETGNAEDEHKRISKGSAKSGHSSQSQQSADSGIALYNNSPDMRPTSMNLPTRPKRSLSDLLLRSSRVLSMYESYDGELDTGLAEPARSPASPIDRFFKRRSAK